MNLKVRIILPTTVVMILMSACSSNPMASVYNNDKKIASENNTFSLGDIEQEISDKKLEAKIDKIEGMETIWSFISEEDMDIELSGEMSVASGKAKLVLILPDNTLVLLAEQDSTSDNTEISQTFSIKKGLNRIKVVAEKNTKLDLDISSTDGEFYELGLDW